MESIYKRAESEQVRSGTSGRIIGQRGKAGGLKIGPLGRHDGPAFVRQNQSEVQTAVAMRVTEDREGLAFKRMTRAGDRHPFREVPDVGSLW